MERALIHYYLDLVRQGGLVPAICNPVTALFLNPIALFRSLRNSAVLLNGHWSHYMSFSSTLSFIKLFYLTQAENLQNHGLRGISPTMGGGGLPLRCLWSSSITSLTLFAGLGGAVSLLLGMLSWSIANLIWLDSAYTRALFVSCTVLLASLTTNFYGNAFDRQNYNVFAWALMPIALYALVYSNIWLGLVVLTASSFLGITVFFFGMLLYVATFALKLDPVYLLPVLPGCLKFGLDFAVSHSKGRTIAAAKTLMDLAAFLGALPGSRYKRPRRFLSVLAFSTMLGIFPAAFAFWGASHGGFSQWQLVALAAVPTLAFFVNQTRLFRVADVQSLLMFHLTVSTGLTIVSGSMLVLVAFWLSNTNALISLALFQHADARPTTWMSGAPEMRPLDMRPFVERCTEFLSPVQPGAHVLLANPDPGSDYNELLARFGPLAELLFWIGGRRGLVVAPDYYVIMYQKQEQLWGEDPAVVATHLRNGKAACVIVSTSAEAPETSWTDSGLQIEARLDWAEFREQLQDSPLFLHGWPCWLLVRLNA